MNVDLNERLKTKGIKVVANVGFKSDPAEALYILKVRSNLAFSKIKDKEKFSMRKTNKSLQLYKITQSHKTMQSAIDKQFTFCFVVSVATRFNTVCFCQKGVV